MLEENVVSSAGTCTPLARNNPAGCIREAGTFHASGTCFTNTSTGPEMPGSAAAGYARAGRSRRSELKPPRSALRLPERPVW